MADGFVSLLTLFLPFPALPSSVSEVSRRGGLAPLHARHADILSPCPSRPEYPLEALRSRVLPIDGTLSLYV